MQELNAFVREFFAAVRVERLLGERRGTNKRSLVDDESDLVQWLETQIGSLRENRLSMLDIEYLIQELEQRVSSHKRFCSLNLRV